MEKYMKINKWLEKNCSTFENKTVVITGTTGGLGHATIKHLAFLKAKVIAGVRNTKRAEEQYEEIKKVFPSFDMTILNVDLTDEASIKSFAEQIIKITPDGIDALINNAGVYAQKSELLKSGFEKHFFVNTIAPVLLSKLLINHLSKKDSSRIIFLSSISIFFTKVNLEDIDSQKIKNKTRIYANSKRLLTYYAMQFAKDVEEKNIKIVIAHPGISASSLFKPQHKGIRRLIFPVQKILMQIVFPSLEKASLCEVFAICSKNENNQWIGPTKIFNIYGFPKPKKLKLKPERLNIENETHNTINSIINSL